MWGDSQQANYRTTCPGGKLLLSGHKSEVYALTYKLVALPFYFTLSFLIQLLRISAFRDNEGVSRSRIQIQHSINFHREFDAQLVLSALENSPL